MFTGLVAGIGRVRIVEPAGETRAIELETELDPGGIGASISVSGCCLTVVEKQAGGLRLVMAAETLAKTTLGRLTAGDRVNLEPALAVGSRLGGHFVQGHVDGVGQVVAKRSVGEATELALTASSDLLRYIVPKGSIALDGVSLTVNAVGNAHFSVLLIPHTLEVTTLGDLAPGRDVNLEVDILAKYVERLLAARLAAENQPEEGFPSPGGDGPTDGTTSIEGITLAFLQEHGFASR